MSLSDFPHPWRLTFNEHGRLDGFLDANGRNIAERRAAVEYMILCGNAHADLLAANTESLYWLEHPAVHDAFRADPELCSRLNAAVLGHRAAIAKATGGDA